MSSASKTPKLNKHVFKNNINLLQHNLSKEFSRWLRVT